MPHSQLRRLRLLFAAASRLKQPYPHWHANRQGAVISMSGTFPVVHRDLIIAMAAQYRLPAVYPFRFQAMDGGLISYG